MRQITNEIIPIRPVDHSFVEVTQYDGNNPEYWTMSNKQYIASAVMGCSLGGNGARVDLQLCNIVLSHQQSWDRGLSFTRNPNGALRNLVEIEELYEGLNVVPFSVQFSPETLLIHDRANLLDGFPALSLYVPIYRKDIVVPGSQEKDTRLFLLERRDFPAAGSELRNKLLIGLQEGLKLPECRDYNKPRKAIILLTEGNLPDSDLFFPVLE